MTGHAIAVDIGGTQIKAALVAVETAPPAARSLREVRRRTPTADGDRRISAGMSAADAIVAETADAIAELRADAAVDAAGVVVPGTVDERRGVGIFSADPPWRDEPLRDKLAARVDLPLTFGHDVRAGGLAEARLGAARGIRDVAVLPIGTGIAAALVLDGRPYSGSGYAGEIGHVNVGHGQPCQCGARGCVEAIASSAAVARRYTARTGKPVDGAAEVAAAVRAGDPEARTVWDEAMEGLAQGLLVLAAVVAPEAVVLGGGLAMAGTLLTAPLRSRLDELVSFHRRPRIELAQLGDTAGCLGAALLAIEQWEAP